MCHTVGFKWKKKHAEVFQKVKNVIVNNIMINDDDKIQYHLIMNV